MIMDYEVYTVKLKNGTINSIVSHGVTSNDFDIESAIKKIVMKDNKFHIGNLYNLLYVSGFFYVLSALIAVFIFGRNLKRRRERYVILLYNLLIFAALIVRLCLPKYLIMEMRIVWLYHI